MTNHQHVRHRRHLLLTILSRDERTISTAALSLVPHFNSFIYDPNNEYIAEFAPCSPIDVIINVSASIDLMKMVVAR